MANKQGESKTIKEHFLSKTKNKIIVVVAILLLVFGLIYYNTNQNNSTSMTTSNIQTLDNGLVIEDTTLGNGAIIQPGDQVTMHYKGTLEDGTVFDSSYDRGQPFPVTIGVGQVIPGWDQGIPGMKIGGKRTLTIPPELAYGEQGVPGAIPPSSTLIFEVEALEKQ